MFSLQQYDYDLPADRIAQEPASRRDGSKLLFLGRGTGVISHHGFADLCNLLSPDDVLVLNDTEVIPARLLGRKATGGSAEVLLLDYAGAREATHDPGAFTCNCLVRASKGAKPGDVISFDKRLQGEVIGSTKGVATIRFSSEVDFEKLLYHIGRTPLPPYIRRREGSLSRQEDSASYQTVYASKTGAIAAPTAGLHFTKALLKKVESKGVNIVAITLHVGYGTFAPVRAEDIRKHAMHSEAFHVSEESAETINRAKRRGGRIVAVGTTCVRTLEFASDSEGVISPGRGECDLFIYPGYGFKAVDAMVTNFHLPKSTLLMLVSAFAGRDSVLGAYREAMEKGYRFYSYGDAMFIA